MQLEEVVGRRRRYDEAGRGRRSTRAKERVAGRSRSEQDGVCADGGVDDEGSREEEVGRGGMQLEEVGGRRRR